MLKLKLLNTFDPDSIPAAEIDCNNIAAAADAFEEWSLEWDGEIAAELSDPHGCTLLPALMAELDEREREGWLDANPTWHADMMVDNAIKLDKEYQT